MQLDSGPRQKPHLYSTTRDPQIYAKESASPFQRAVGARETLHASLLGCNESCGRAVHSPPELDTLSHPFFAHPAQFRTMHHARRQVLLRLAGCHRPQTILVAHLSAPALLCLT